MTAVTQAALSHVFTLFSALTSPYLCPAPDWSLGTREGGGSSGPPSPVSQFLPVYSTLHSCLLFSLGFAGFSCALPQSGRGPSRRAGHWTSGIIMSGIMPGLHNTCHPLSIMHSIHIPLTPFVSHNHTCADTPYEKVWINHPQLSS